MDKNVKRAATLLMGFFFLFSSTAFGLDRNVPAPTEKPVAKAESIKAITDKKGAKKKTASEKKTAVRNPLFFLLFLGKNTPSSR